MPSEPSQDHAARLIMHLNEELCIGDAAGRARCPARRYDPVRFLNLMDCLAPANQLKVIDLAEKLAKTAQGRNS